MNTSELQKYIGRLCVFGFEETTLPVWIRKLILEWDLSGVILFKRNIESLEQVRELNREIRTLRKDRPILISVDHEGGRVFRLPPPFTQIPTARSIGKNYAQGDREKPFQIGALMGRELHEAGFNLDFAPVLDVDTNAQNPIIGDRAFGSDPKLVSDVSLELARGLRSQGVLPCGKHFPGHGDTALDSHLDLPVVDLPLSRLQSVEYVPFQAAIQNQIEMLMTAHVLYPQLDPHQPATLSKTIITDVLRNEMGYNGVVISDDFNMKAIADRYPLVEAVHRFWEAGGDLVLVCRYQEICEGLLEAVLKKLKDGEWSGALLKTSHQRVDQLIRRIL